MSLVSFLKGAAFDPETLATLAAAFDKAWDTLKKSGSPLASPDEAEATRERLARRIIEMGQRGERDHRRLVDDALAHIAER